MHNFNFANFVVYITLANSNFYSFRYHNSRGSGIRAKPFFLTTRVVNKSLRLSQPMHLIGLVGLVLEHMNGLLPYHPTSYMCILTPRRYEDIEYLYCCRYKSKSWKKTNERMGKDWAVRCWKSTTRAPYCCRVGWFDFR